MTLDQAGRIQRLMPGRTEPEETIKIKGVNPDPKLVQVLLCLQCLVSTYIVHTLLFKYDYCLSYDTSKLALIEFQTEIQIKNEEAVCPYEFPC